MMKKRGEIESFDVGELSGEPLLKGCVLKLRHEGPGIVRRWAMRQQQWRLEEARRVRALVESMGEDLIREVYADTIEAVQESAGEELPLFRCVQTPEGQESFVALQRSIVAEVAEEFAGIKEPVAIAEELERLGVLAVAWLKAQEVQRLSPTQFPFAASARDDGPEQGASAESGA